MVVLCSPNKHDDQWTDILEVKGESQRVNANLSADAVNLDENEDEAEDECLTAESLCQVVYPASRNCSAQTSNPVYQNYSQTSNPTQKT